MKYSIVNSYYMKKTIVVVSLLLLGFGCTPDQRLTDGVNSTEDSQLTVVKKDVENTEASNSEVKPPETAPKKLAVKRSFTLEEIEAKGGLKNWFRDLARANVAGTKTLVRVPINRVFGFGCETPTSYCVSTETTGCFGPFVDLLGDTAVIDKTTKTCHDVCDSISEDTAERAPVCSQEFRNNQCSTLWEVEGYVVAANRLPEAKDDGTPGTCADGELAYDFEVTRVIQKIDGGYSEDFQFYEYK